MRGTERNDKLAVTLDTVTDRNNRKFAVYNAHFLKLSNRSLRSIYGNIVLRSQNTQALYMVTVLMGNKNSTDIPLADTYAVELQ